MNIADVLAALNLGEDKDWEFKSAKGGLPGSIWPTYSAMANTEGGSVVLGVKEQGEQFEIQGLDDPHKLMQDFWNSVNNRNKVSLNLLSNSDVAIESIDDKPVLVIRVPRATRTQRPVYVGLNPLNKGTYRRYNEGDYECNPDEVGRMLADQSEQPADSMILEHFKLDDLDILSLQQYRNRFASRLPTHPWLNKDDRGLLELLGGWRKDRITGQHGLTVAGLLMFGKEESIRDPNAVPQFNLDYREHLSDHPSVRWTDRIWSDGTWAANLFQFFLRVYPRLVTDLKIPFHYQSSTTETSDSVQRRDETVIHEAIREAFVNSMIHADFRGQGGVVIERNRDQLIFSNPGSLLVSVEQMLEGGVSECRNKSLQTMFAMVGYGEKAGSGIDKIKQGWATQKWRWPNIMTRLKPDRIQLVLPMVSLLPEKSLLKLQQSLGDSFSKLNSEEVQALVTAEVEGNVSNQRLQQFSRQHRTEITKTLQGLVLNGCLSKEGHGPWATYRLVSSGHSDELTPDITAADSGHNGSAPDITNGTMSGPLEENPQLLAIAEPARQQSRLDPQIMESIIRIICKDYNLTFRQLATLLDREAESLQRSRLRPMVKSGQLRLLYPDEPNHPRQAYRTNPDWNLSQQ